MKKIAYGEQYWLKGVESKQPDGYFDWDVQHRKEHNLAEESFVLAIHESRPDRVKHPSKCPTPSLSYIDPDPKSCSIQKQNSGMMNTSLSGGCADEKSRFTEEQIVFALKQAELGTSVPEVCRKLGISDATFTSGEKIWRDFPSELKHMRQLEEENLRLKKLVADLSLDKAMLQDVLAKELTLARLREWARACRHVTGPARDRSVLHYKSAAALSATALWRQTTVHSACESGKSPKPGFIMATAEFTSCSGGRAGG